MRREERTTFLNDLWNEIYKRGMPINIRNGAVSEIASWAEDIAEDLLEEDEPLGTVNNGKYEACPRCGGVIGVSAYYCKKCGAWLRQVM